MDNFDLLGDLSKGRMSSRRNEADVRRREGMGKRASCYLPVLDSSIFWIPMDRWPWVYWDLLCPYRMCVLSLQSCPTLCDPMDCSPPGSSVHGIFQGRILEWVSMPSSRYSCLGIKPASLSSPALAGEFCTTSATWEALALIIEPSV